MPLNFPTSPIDGQVYDNYTYSEIKGTWLLNDTSENTAQIADLQNDVAALDIRVGETEFDISVLDSRLDQAEAQIVAPIALNGNTISANYTIPSGYNGVSAGPITIASGVTVTIPTGSAWSIV